MGEQPPILRTDAETARRIARAVRAVEGLPQDFSTLPGKRDPVFPARIRLAEITAFVAAIDATIGSYTVKEIDPADHADLRTALTPVYVIDNGVALAVGTKGLLGRATNGHLWFMPDSTNAAGEAAAAAARVALDWHQDLREFYQSALDATDDLYVQRGAVSVDALWDNYGGIPEGDVGYTSLLTKYVTALTGTKVVADQDGAITRFSVHVYNSMAHETDFYFKVGNVTAGTASDALTIADVAASANGTGELVLATPLAFSKGDVLELACYFVHGNGGTWNPTYIFSHWTGYGPESHWRRCEAGDEPVSLGVVLEGDSFAAGAIGYEPRFRLANATAQPTDDWPLSIPFTGGGTIDGDAVPAALHYTGATHNSRPVWASGGFYYSWSGTVWVLAKALA